MEYKNKGFEAFINDCCILTNDGVEQSAYLYKAYINYCYDKILNKISTYDFYKELETMGLKRIVHKRIKYFKGIKLTDEAYNLYIELGLFKWAEKRK